MSAPDLLYSEVEEDLRANVRRLLRDRCDWTAVLARCETDEPYDLALWRTLAGELGLAALLVPEDLGGAGAGARELAVVAEEVGRAVAPVPFWATCSPPPSWCPAASSRGSGRSCRSSSTAPSWAPSRSA